MRRVVPILVALLSACARTPQSAPAAKRPGPDAAALRDAAFRDLRCPDALPALPASALPTDAIAAVALADRTAYALSNGGRLWIWDEHDPARVFDPARFVSLARDGSVAVASAPAG